MKKKKNYSEIFAVVAKNVKRPNFVIVIVDKIHFR